MKPSPLLFKLRSPINDLGAGFSGGVSRSLLPALVQHVCSAIDRFDCGQLHIQFPNLVLPGNLLVLTIQYANAESISTITDDKGNTWNAGPTCTNVASGRILALFYVENAIANTNAVTVQFTTNNATDIRPQATMSEFYNIATSGSGDGSSSSSTSQTAGSITTTQNNDLIFHAGVDFSDTSGTGGAFNGTSITKGSGFTLLSADLQVGTCAQYQVQGTAGAINPAFTSSGASTWGSVAMAFKFSAGAGTSPPKGIRIVHLYHVLLSAVNVQGRATRLPLQFPCTGNLIVGVWNCGTGVPTITAISDSKSNTWSFPAWTRIQNPAGACATHLVYAANAATDTDLNTLTVTGSAAGTGDEMFLLYDIAGADASPFDVSATAKGTQSANGAVTTVSLTPLTVGSLVINGTAWDSHTANSLVSPTNGIFDTVWNDFDDDGAGSGGTNASTLEMDHGHAHVYCPDLTALTFTYNYNPFKASVLGVGGWAAVAVAFTPAGVPGSQSASEDFNIADEAPLSHGSLWASTTNSISVVSNKSQPTGTASDREAIFQAWGGGNDYLVEMEITEVGGSTGVGYGVCVRHNAAVNTKTMMRAVLNGSGQYEVMRFVTGTGVSLRTGTVTYAAGTKLGLLCKGSTYRLYYPYPTQVGADIADGTALGTLPGIAYSSTATSASGDNWACRSVADAIVLQTLPRGIPTILIPKWQPFRAIAAGFQNLFLTATDAPTFAESMARTLAALRGSSEAATTAESASRASSQPRATSDAPTTAESSARQLAATRATTDAPATTSPAARLLSAFRSATDAPATSEAATRLVALLRSAAEAASTSESAVRTTGPNRSATDAPITAESATRSEALLRAATEATTTSEAASKAQTATRTATDAATTAEAATRALQALRAAAEALTTAESVARLSSLLRSTTDHPQTAEAIARLLALFRVAADAPTTSDAATRTQPLARTAAEAASTSESVVRTTGPNRSATDSVSTAEAVARLVSLARTATDGPTTAMASARILAGLRASQDSPSLAESVARGAVRSRTAADALSASEAVAQLHGKLAAAAESLGLSEAAVAEVVSIVQRILTFGGVAKEITLLMEADRGVTVGVVEDE